MIQLLNPLKLQAKGILNPPSPPAERVNTMKFTYGNGDRPLAGYTIKRGVGIGGFGEVYFAINDAGKEVALKRIQRNLDVEVRGVRQCLNLKHPNLIALFDIQFDQEEQGWIVMEYVSGGNLRDLVERYPTGLPMPELCHWFGQIVAGVTYLHEHGVVHRDLKPANIFEDQGIVKIGDYGLSKYISCSRRGGQTESVGTFHYMAPEIGKGEYGKEIDVYALGVMLYEMATGNVPFDGESTQEIIMKHLTSDPDLSKVAWPVREVCSRALQKDPLARYRDVREMVRPLGLEIDQRYMVTNSISSSQPPVITPIEATGGQAFVNRLASSPQVADGKHNAAPPTGSVNSLHYDEPIAAAIKGSWIRVSQWWRGLPLNPGMRGAVLALGIIVCFNFIPGLFGLLLPALMMYIPYYIVWCLVCGVRSNGVSEKSRRQTPPPLRGQPQAHVNPFAHQARPVAAPVPPVKPAPHKPLSVRQWRVAKRRQLSQEKVAHVLSSVTGTWFVTAIVLIVFSALVAIFQIGTGQAQQGQLVTIAWSTLISLATAWSVIGLGKRWETTEGDWAVRSFVQLTFGLGIGLLAYGTADFLEIAWPTGPDQLLRNSPLDVHSDSRRWPGFFSTHGQPLLPAYLAYFPLLLGLVHWWKQVDPLRRTRFSLLSVIWSVLAAWIVYLIIPFPLPWGAVIAAGTSIAVQLSSHWIDPDERLHVDSLRSIV